MEGQLKIVIWKGQIICTITININKMLKWAVLGGSNKICIIILTRETLTSILGFMIFEYTVEIDLLCALLTGKSGFVFESF